ncbi:MAG: proline dehydrogenase family protein [Candidatus Marinimicrobia bacterium]|nr:proline dehydrogenase family protein [Candidatus Neomarinimicrobiota bacterium]
MFNKLVVALMPLAPRAIVKMISKRYIAGMDAAAAIAKCQDLKDSGFLTTMDILGEAVTTETQAAEALDSYLALISEVSQSGIEKNISLKPTALGLAVSEELALQNISSIVTKAKQAGIFIRLDMEDSPYTSKTLRMYEQLRADYPHMGTVIQAYMHRSLDDVKSIAAHGGNLRICKGIYKESPKIAYQDKNEIRENYLKLLATMFSNNAYVGIATHDHYLIDQSLQMIEDMDIAADRYEFQALLGVPIVDRLTELIHDNHRVRIYVPFGVDWYAYSSRRLKENPDIAGYVLKNIFQWAS